MMDFKEKYDRYMHELALYCHDKVPCRKYSMQAKYPSKVVWFIEAMNWRIKECCEGAVILLDANLVIPSAALIRSALENLAILHKMKKMVIETVCNNTISNDLDKELMRFLFANKYKKGVFVDDNTYELFHQYQPDTVALLMDGLDEDVGILTKGQISIKKFYSNLCEFVHTNTDGIMGAYSDLDEDNEMINFGPQITPSHPLYDAFPLTLLVALDLYIVDMRSIYDNLPEFTKVCEEKLKRQKISNFHK